MANIPDNFYIALALTLFAGLATLLGGCITFVVKKNNMKVLSLGLGFSAGVMIFLSFTEILSEANELLEKIFPITSQWFVLIGFVSGILVAILIDYFLPDHIEGDLFNENVDVDSCQHKHRIKRAGVFTALAIAVHNFPEGMTTFFVSTQNIAIGASVAVAIAIHNIPEGIAVALPIYHATGKKLKAIWYSFLAGISEPIGALIALLVFHFFIPEIFIGFLCAAVAGIMIYISFDTLLPLAKEYGDWHISITGIITGIIVMWISILLLQ